MNEQLKAFDKVLVRADGIGSWMCDLYSHYDSDTEYHICVGGRYDCCIPYEGNEHLLGTTDAPTPKRWRVEDEDFYYFIDATFNVDCEEETYSDIDNRRFEIGNYFRTKTEAEEMAEKFKAMLKGE